MYAKTIKRDFEVKLTLDQSVGLSQLTREVMQVSNKAFTEQLPEKTPSQPTLIWQLAIDIQQNDLKDALHSFTSFMTSHEECLSETLIDEGFFFSETLYHQIDTSLSFERLVLALLTSNLIYQTERNEPLWVTHTDKNATLQRGVILKPDLFEAILTLETEEECFNFFEDVCTVNELLSIAQRFAVAKMLKEDNTYLEVAEKTGASTATISRVNRSLNYGKDGYELVFSRMNLDKEKKDSE